MSERTYLTDDCTVSVPTGFRDRSSNVLEWKTQEGDSVVLVIQREPIPPSPIPGEEPPPFDLHRYIGEQTGEYPSQFPSFSLERDEASAPGASFPMQRKAFRWRKDNEVLYHHQAFVLAGARIVVLTVASKARHRVQVDTLMDEVIANFRVRGD